MVSRRRTLRVSIRRTARPLGISRREPATVRLMLFHVSEEDPGKYSV